MTSVLLPNLSIILESVLIPILVILELESPTLGSHIQLWGNDCGLKVQVLDLDPLPKQILTPESLLDFSQFSESIVVYALPDSRSIISSFHTPFWNKGVENNDTEIIFKI